MPREQMSYFIIKRFIDFLMAIILIILLSPVLILELIIVKFLLKESPIYIQKRLTKHRDEFNLIKIKTMRSGSNEIFSNPFIRCLRKSGLDELPQLFNVIKGDMSLIGPRPLPVSYSNLIKQEHQLRFKVLPGITGLSQVSRAEVMSWNERFEMDNLYVTNQSFSEDIKILIETIKLIFSGGKRERMDVLTTDY